MKALLRLDEGSIKALLSIYFVSRTRLGICNATLAEILALLRLYYGSIKAVLRLYYGSMKALLRLYFVSRTRLGICNAFLAEILALLPVTAL
jgi:hypothetical protein